MKKLLFLLLLPFFAFGQKLDLSLDLPFGIHDTYIATTSVFITYNGTNIIPAMQAIHDAVPDYSNIELVLPAGTFIALGTLNITKHLFSITGRGKDTTTLYRPESYSDAALNATIRMIYFNINDRGSNKVHVSGITFKSKSYITSSAADVGVQFNKCIDFSVHDCRFENFGNGAIRITHYDDLARGVIYHNQFWHNAKQPDGLGLGYGIVLTGEDLVWKATPEYGTDNFIFIEDNEFDYHRHSIANGGTALFVFRYNMVRNNIIGANAGQEAVNTHGARGGVKGNGNYFSSRAVEIYNNNVLNRTYKNGTLITAFTSTISADSLITNAINIRGGEALVWGNNISGFRFGVSQFIEDLTVSAIGTVCPIFYAIGYPSTYSLTCSHTGINLPNGDGDMFSWYNNFQVYTDGVNSSSKYYNYLPTYLSAGRDYHNDTIKPLYTPFIYPHPLRSARTMAAYEANKYATYSPHATALFAAMAVQPTVAQKAVYNYAIRTYLDETGLFNELDFLHVEFVGTGLGAQAASINWINPATYSLTPFNMGSTFVEKSGYPGVNASSTYLKTNFIPSTNGIKYTLNDCSYGCYNKLNIQDGNNISIGVYDGTNFSQLLNRDATNVSGGYVNETGGAGGNFSTITIANGLRSLIRTSSTVTVHYFNGSVVNTKTTNPSSATVTKQFYVGARNTNGTASLFSNNVVQMDFAGSSLAGGAYSINLYNMMNYLIANMP